MSEAAGSAKMKRRLIERSLQDDVFRQQLLADPRAIIEREIGTQLPEDLRVVAVEETADTIYLVLPSTSPVGEGGELADQTLEAVAGGDAGSTSTFSLCNISCDPNCMY
jgi:hypothetical protein